jgi:hypothetical protein
VTAVHEGKHSFRITNVFVPPANLLLRNTSGFNYPSESISFKLNSSPHISKVTYSLEQGKQCKSTEINHQ